MSVKLVSIIIPTYNTEMYISSCINSVLNQSYPNIEIIIINDGSTDNTEKEILKFKDSRIHYIKQKNQGVSVARNTALKIINGDYFCFLDADDLFQKIVVNLV